MTHRFLSPAAAEAIAVATCKRCGALVPDGSAEVHLAWHRKIEGLA